MKRQAALPLIAGIFALSGCTAALAPSDTSTSPTPSSESADALQIEKTPLTLRPPEEAPGLWRTENHTDINNAPITRAGVRAPEQLHAPVEAWATERVDSFSTQVTSLSDEKDRQGAQLSMDPGICGASGTVLCYAIDAQTTFPASAPQHSESRYHAWITDSRDGFVMESTDLLSTEGRTKIHEQVPGDPTAIFPNEDGSLTLAVNGEGYRVSSTHEHAIDPMLSPDGKRLRHEFMAGTPLERIPHPKIDCQANPCVALTFDDGPGPYTAQLLDTLKEKDSKATFFLIGSHVSSYPDQVKREAEEGHAVGNHTWDHADLSKQSAATITNEVAATDQAIMDAGAPQPILVRPPYGATSPTVHSILASRGQAEIHWSIDTLDWKNLDVAKDIEMATATAQPGSIILMHDIHPETVAAVPEIIDDLHLAGYDLVTVPELLGGPVSNYLGFSVFSQQ